MASTPDQPGDGPSLDLVRLVDALRRHEVEYILVGGGAALGHGAQRPTQDLDCLPRPDAENLQRLADAMRELGARIHAEGLSDAESRRLPVVLDARTLSSGSRRSAHQRRRRPVGL